MSVEAHGKGWRVRVRWRGVISLSSTCESESDADELNGALEKFHKAEGGDVLLSWLHDHKEALPNAVLLARKNAPKKIEHLTIADLKGIPSKDPQTLTVGQSYDQWMEFMKDGENRRGSGYADSTMAGYKFVWKKFFGFLPAGRDTRVSDISDDTLIAYRSWLLKGGQAQGPDRGTKRSNTGAPSDPAEPKKKIPKKRQVQPAGANRHIMAIRSWHSWVGDKVRGLGLKLESVAVSFGRERHSTKRAILPKDLDAIRSAFRKQEVRGTTRWLDLIEFLLETGLREQEAQQLTYAEIRSEHALAIKNTERRHVKTEESVRHVPLSPRARAILRRYSNPKARPKDPVFPDALRSKWGLQSAWVRARAASGVNARIHDLRHTRAVLWLIDEGDLDQVSRWLGHKLITTTQTYTKSRADYELALGIRKPRRQRQLARRKRA